MIRRIESGKDFAEVVKALNNAQSTSLAELSEMSCVNRQNLFRVLKGCNPTLQTMLKILNALGGTLMVTQSPTYYENR